MTKFLSLHHDDNCTTIFISFDSFASPALVSGGLAKETNGLKIVVFLPFCIVQVEYFFESIAFCLESSAGIY